MQNNFGTKGCMYCEGECNKECLLKEETSYESWKDIEEDYLKENYPVFGGPFTDALTPFEWLKQYFNSPKRKK